jgi:L-aminopeptidase/D-esterase-like protein
MKTTVPGFTIGHWTDDPNSTGCTVVLCPPSTVASCDVRGSSPGSRELALLSPEKTMQEVHAILLTGGSAFGLAAADGIMKFLEERNRGYLTPWARVPIVPAAVIFDLNLGSSAVRPDARSGYQACENASSVTACGNIGAGTGATVGKWAGRETWMKGGCGSAYAQDGDLAVGVLAVVNAVGDVIDEHGAILAGARSQAGEFLAKNDPHRTLAKGKVLPDTNTTLVVVMTNASLTKVEVLRIAQRAHDGMARAIVPVHTSYDGDIAFAAAAGSVMAPLDLVAEIGAALTAEAIRTAVRSAASLPGVMGLKTV